MNISIVTFGHETYFSEIFGEMYLGFISLFEHLQAVQFRELVL